MPKLTYTWTATFETTIDVTDSDDIDEVRDSGANINIPEDADSKYVSDTWEIQTVVDEENREIIF